MNAALLLLTDSRLPAGGHAHSGGTERAIASGAVHDVPSLARFLRGRLHVAGTLSAALTAAAALQAAHPAADPTRPPAAPRPGSATPAATPVLAARGVRPDAGGGAALEQPQPIGDAAAESKAVAGGGAAPEARHITGGAGWGGAAGSPWARLDEEVDARTASPAQRDASRTQGRLLLRVARRVWPSEVLDELARDVPNPHHPLALGVAAHAAGATPEEAAMAAAYHAISGPATAAVRLLGLDPVAVHALLADFAPDLAAVAAEACLAATSAFTDPAVPRWEALPAYSAPALDLLAEQHMQAEVRLFVS
ncbi:urease accessory protein UreF [Nonomuraea sp. SYSU D8015]|uniref:urease accessory protein UreF n=1 Tax=Nonomuraea sp. SYSU D8015 TaxID=2593644 RepID=UPI0016602AA7|nr:urease accessory UreF family protein [Nonomuraea sp. SYSU D8015]